VSQFKLSSQVDINKVFLINQHSLDARLDVEFYQPKHFKLLTRLSSSRYPLKTLKDISKKIVDGPFGSSVKTDDYVENGIPFLRVADITHGDGTIELEGLIFISPKKHQEISRSTVFPNDVIIAKTGATMGAASIVPETIKEANIRGDLAAVTVNDSVIANYIANFINTQIGQDLFWRLNSGATRGRVVISNLRKYPIVIPDTNRMVEINQFIDAAKKRKNQKEEQAKALLAGIDDYLLAELGITLPMTSTPKKFFYTLSTKVIGERIDPFYHQIEFKELEQLMIEGKYEIRSFSNFITYISSGATPLKSDSGKYYTEDIKSGVPLLRVQNITEEGLKLDDVIFINRETHEKSLKRSQVFSGDLLITITGRIASSAVAPKCFEGNINQHSVVVRTHQNHVLNEYLSIYFNSYLGQKFAFRKTTGGTRPALDYYALKSIKIPIPPLEKQAEIAAHVGMLRNHAEQLQQQAQAELEKAKAEVERMILGE